MVYDKKNDGDPFAVRSLPKAFYHPSKEKQLSQSQRKTAISPGRPGKNEDVKERSKSPVDQLFLQDSHSYHTKTPGHGDISGSSKFDESWPSSERPSTVGDDPSPFSVTNYAKKYSTLEDLKRTLQFPTEKDGRQSHSTATKPDQPSESSTLQRYIERFRKAEPRSREERTKQNGAKMKDFWWLAERSHDQSHDRSHDQTRDTTKKNEESQEAYPLTQKTLQQFTVPPSPMDAKTRYIQERAQKLLEKSDNTSFSSDPAVSTDGLGSSSSAGMSSFDEQPYRPMFTRAKEDVPKFELDAKKRLTKPARPEDDILYQWRLQRKLETARNTAHLAPSSGGKTKSYVQPETDKVHKSDVEARLEEFKERLSRLELSGIDTPKRSANIQFTAAPDKSHVEHDVSVDQLGGSARSDNPPIASPTLGRKKIDGVDPHLHLMCDVLPCPHQDNYKSKYSSQKEYDDGQKHSKPLSDRDKFKHSSEQDQKQTCPKHPSDRDKYDDISEQTNRYVNRNITNDKNIDEKVKNKHLLDENERYKYLEAERPDIEDQTHHTNTDTRQITGDKTQEKQIDIDEIQDNKIRDVQYDSDNDERITTTKVKSRQRADKNLVPKPRFTDSSPISRRKQPPRGAPMEDVIGQVVKDRLFNASASTLVSSVESLPSFSASRQNISSSIEPDHHLSSTRVESTKETTDDIYESDGEFPNDDLLKILRQQRSQYEEKLRKIDLLLSAEER